MKTSLTITSGLEINRGVNKLSAVGNRTHWIKGKAQQLCHRPLTLLMIVSD